MAWWRITTNQGAGSHTEYHETQDNDQADPLEIDLMESFTEAKAKLAGKTGKHWSNKDAWNSREQDFFDDLDLSDQALKERQKERKWKGWA